MLNQYTRKWYAFIGVTLLSFGCYLDYTVVNIAMPTIQHILQADLTQMQWVMNIYFLALCVLATIMGQLGDLYGRRRLFYLGAIIFALASLLAGFSPNIGLLITGRLLQGVGAAIVFPLGASLLPTAFPEAERNKSIAWLGSMGGIALALGPVLGGIILTYVGWRWIFFINIPIIILGFLFCYYSLNESKVTPRHHHLDWWGMLCLTISMGGIVLALMTGETAGWAHGMAKVYLLTSVIAIIMLIKIERRHPDPLIDFNDFNHPTFYGGAMLCGAAGALSAVTLFFDPLYLQMVQKQSPQLSGFVLGIIPVAMFLASLAVNKLVQQCGLLYTTLIGLSLGAAAILLHIFFTPTTSITYIAFTFIALGCIWAMGNTVPIMAAQTIAKPERVSVATGTMITMFNIGGAMGVSLSVAVYSLATTWVLNQHLAAAQSNHLDMLELKQLILNPTHLTKLPAGATHDFFRDLFMGGFTGVMVFFLVAMLIGILSILLVKQRAATRYS